MCCWCWRRPVGPHFIGSVNTRIFRTLFHSIVNLLTYTFFISSFIHFCFLIILIKISNLIITIHSQTIEELFAPPFRQSNTESRTGCRGYGICLCDIRTIFTGLLNRAARCLAWFGYGLWGRTAQMEVYFCVTFVFYLFLHFLFVCLFHFSCFFFLYFICIKHFGNLNLRLRIVSHFPFLLICLPKEGNEGSHKLWGWFVWGRCVLFKWS